MSRSNGMDTGASGSNGGRDEGASGAGTGIGRARSWHTEARAMHAADPELTCTEIGLCFGYSPSAVWKALHPERAREINRRSNTQPGRQAQKNAWTDEYDRRPEIRGTCATPCCSNLRGRRAAKKRPANRERTRIGRRTYTLGYCQACIDAIHAVRRSLAEGAWAAGWSSAEFEAIASMNASTCRARGWDVPLRRSRPSASGPSAVPPSQARSATNQPGAATRV